MPATQTYSELVSETQKTDAKRKITLTRGHYPLPANQGGYIASVGGVERLWFGYWTPRATGSDYFASRFVALGWLQVAQACLNNTAFPISEAAYALREFMAFYRHHAYRKRDCGASRDGVDIAAYLVSAAATKDGQPFLRAGLRQEEDTKRRNFALRMLRVAACDLARDIEQAHRLNDRMDTVAAPLSAAFRVPYLPLNWRTNPYYDDWDALPFGFSRPIWVSEMRENSITKTMYAFSGKDPVTQRWVFRPVNKPWYDDAADAVGDFFEDIVDDIGDFFKEVGEFFEKYIDELIDWICENQAAIAGAITAIVTAVEVAGACVGTLGAACGAAVAAAPAAAAAQYEAIAEPLAAACGTYATAKMAVGVVQIEDRIKAEAKKAVDSNSFVLSSKQEVRAVQTKARNVQRKVEDVLADVEREVRRVINEIVKKIRDTLKGIVDPLVKEVKQFALDLLKDIRNAVGSSISATGAAVQSAGIAAEKAVEKYLDFDFIAGYFYEKAEGYAREAVRPLVEAKVRVVSGLVPNTAKATAGDLFAVDMLVRVATRSADEAQRRGARLGVESDKARKLGTYNGMPRTTFSALERSAPVFLGLFVGMPEDAINEVLFARGPVVGSINRPTLNDIKGAMLNKAVDASMEQPVFLGAFDPARTSFPIAFNARRNLEASRERLVLARLTAQGKQNQKSLRAVPSKVNVFPASMLRAAGDGSGGRFFGFGGEQILLRQDIGNDVTRQAYGAVLSEENGLVRRLGTQPTVDLMLAVIIQQTNTNITTAIRVERETRARQAQADDKRKSQQQQRQQEDRMIAAVKARYSKPKSKKGSGLLLIGAAAAAAFYIS